MTFFISTRLMTALNMMKNHGKNPCGTTPSHASHEA
nr:MAG TPA: hypothetical protein [Caudoviricetes sp.]